MKSILKSFYFLSLLIFLVGCSSDDGKSKTNDDNLSASQILERSKETVNKKENFKADLFANYFTLTNNSKNRNSFTLTADSNNLDSAKVDMVVNIEKSLNDPISYNYIHYYKDGKTFITNEDEIFLEDELKDGKVNKSILMLGLDQIVPETKFNEFDKYFDLFNLTSMKELDNTYALELGTNIEKNNKFAMELIKEGRFNQLKLDEEITIKDLKYIVHINKKTFELKKVKIILDYLGTTADGQEADALFKEEIDYSNYDNVEAIEFPEKVLKFKGAVLKEEVIEENDEIENDVEEVELNSETDEAK